MSATSINPPVAVSRRRETPASGRAGPHGVACRRRPGLKANRFSTHGAADEWLAAVLTLVGQEAVPKVSSRIGVD